MRQMSRRKTYASISFQLYMILSLCWNMKTKDAV
jgi:hypothetical protein